MLGHMLSKVRKEKGLTKVEITRRTGLNIGHLTHIEKDERNPSHKTLKSLTKALGIPYTILTSLYDKKMTEDDERCEMIKHLSYNKVLTIDSYSNFIECPADIPYASAALKIQDDVMEPLLPKGSYVFLELNVPLKNKEFGLFQYNGEIFIRRFVIRKDKLVLRAENKKYTDIELTEDDDFIIIGKVIKKK